MDLEALSQLVVGERMRKVA
jgi:hypothetical protein